MRKINAIFLGAFLIGIVSCKETKEEQEKLDATLDKIESVEEAIDETIKEVEEKAEDVEEALKELENI